MFCFFLLSLWGTSQIAPAATFDFQTLKNLIVTRNFTAVEQVVSALPPEYLTRYTLVYASRSLQGASPEFPRVIAFGTEAKLVIAFNGNPEAPGYNSLETAEFDDAQKKFVFRRVDFTGGTAEFSEDNPVRCLKCHQQDPRPNWDEYFFWPGVFGAEDQGMFGPGVKGNAAKFPVEKALFARYQSHQTQEPYKSLIPLKGVDGAPDSGSSYNGVPKFPDGRYDFFMRGDHNLALSQLLGGLNSQRIVRKITSDPETFKLRYALLAALSCTAQNFTADQGNVEDFIPENLKVKFPLSLQSFQAEVVAKNRKSLTDRLQRHFSVTGLTAPEDDRLASFIDGGALWTMDGNDGHPPAAAVAYLLQNTTLKMDDWSMELEIVANQSAMTFGNGRGQMGGVEEFYWRAVLQPSKDQELESMYKAAAAGGFFGPFLAWGDEANRAKLCETLRAKSLQELN